MSLFTGDKSPIHGRYRLAGAGATSHRLPVIKSAGWFMNFWSWLNVAEENLERKEGAVFFNYGENKVSSWKRSVEQLREQGTRVILVQAEWYVSVQKRLQSRISQRTDYKVHVLRKEDHITRDNITAFWWSCNSRWKAISAQLSIVLYHKIRLTVRFTIHRYQQYKTVIIR